MWGRNPENNRAGTLLESHCDSSESVAIHSRFRTKKTYTYIDIHSIVVACGVQSYKGFVRCRHPMFEV